MVGFLDPIPTKMGISIKYAMKTVHLCSAKLTLVGKVIQDSSGSTASNEMVKNGQNWRFFFKKPNFLREKSKKNQSYVKKKMIRTFPNFSSWLTGAP